MLPADLDSLYKSDHVSILRRQATSNGQQPENRLAQCSCALQCLSVMDLYPGPTLQLAMLSCTHAHFCQTWPGLAKMMGRCCLCWARCASSILLATTDCTQHHAY